MRDAGDAVRPVVCASNSAIALLASRSPVEFAALEHLHDDLEQPFVGERGYRQWRRSCAGSSTRWRRHRPPPRSSSPEFRARPACLTCSVTDPTMREGRDGSISETRLGNLPFGRQTRTLRAFHPEIGSPRLGTRIDGCAKSQPEVMQKQNAPDPENRSRCALSGLTALPVHCPLLAAGLLRWPAWPLADEEILRADTGSGRSRTARGGAATCSASRTPRSRCRRPAPPS